MIKYFFLKIGKKEFFQPQNKYKRGLNYAYNGLVLQSQGYPEVYKNELFLNGDSKTSANIILTGENSISQFIPVIKQYNKEFYNV